MNNYNSIDIFKNGLLEDARLYGDGYDFQVTINESSFLAEIKGIRKKRSIQINRKRIQNGFRI